MHKLGPAVVAPNLHSLLLKSVELLTRLEHTLRWVIATFVKSFRMGCLGSVQQKIRCGHLPFSEVVLLRMDPQ